jgi:kynurenine formamidase
VLALASDNPAVEALPADHALHIAMLRGRGVPLGELWALRELATACRADGRYDFLLNSVPLRIHGAFGSPINAVAIR